MNNKMVGSDWEREVCGLFAVNGWWVHFLIPDMRGAQPFDVIAAKGKAVLAIECKTVEGDTFYTSRLEDNQLLGLEKWQKCTNREPIIAVKSGEHRGYITLRQAKSGKSFKIALMNPIEQALNHRLWGGG